MKNKLYKLFLLICLVSLPYFSFAQLTPSPSSINTIMRTANVQQGTYLSRTGGILASALGILDEIIIPIVFALALVYFFYGVAKYIKSEDKAKGREIMTWGVVAIAVMSSIWGIVYWLQGELQVGRYDTANMPRINYR